MKLLQINSVINSGSTGRIAEEIGQAAILNGWESFIAYGRNERESKSIKIRIGDKWNVRWHGLQTRLFDNHGLASKKATRQLINRIKEISPDIIHLHNLHGYYLNIEILFNYLALTEIPIVWTLHDCWSITGHCCYFSMIDCEKWQTHCFQCPQKKDYPSSYLKDNSYNNYKIKRKLFTSISNMTLVPVSNWLADIMKESYLKEYSIKVIHNGIDIEIFKPTNSKKINIKYNLLNKFIILGVASVWNKRKGLDDFVKLSKSIDNNYAIIVVGLSKEQARSMPKNIIVIERTESTEELADLYSSVDVFFNPTYEDNFPTTNIEALACGTPVITYRTGGSPEAISPETGFVVEQGDLNSVKNAIGIIKNKGKSACTITCRKRAVECFNKNDRYNEYIQLYDNILNK